MTHGGVLVDIGRRDCLPKAPERRNGDCGARSPAGIAAASRARKYGRFKGLGANPALIGRINSRDGTFWFRDWKRRPFGNMAFRYKEASSSAEKLSL
jgi:hypothetical protein